MELTVLLLLSSTPAWAQTAVPFPAKTGDTLTMIQEGQRIVTSAQPDDVVARVMSFDRDGDGRVAKAELSERMESVLADADTSGDGALDESEVRAAAQRPAVQSAVRGFQPGRYGFGDESGESSRLHIECVLADLKLADRESKEASAILKAFLDDLDAKTRAELLETMADILPDLQLAKLKAALAPRSQVRTIAFTGTNAPALLLIVGNGHGGVGITFTEGEKLAGVAAIERFNQRQRLAEDADKRALLDQLDEVLTGEQREDLGAALSRRPIAKTGGPSLVVDAFQMRQTLEELRSISVR